MVLRSVYSTKTFDLQYSYRGHHIVYCLPTSNHYYVLGQATIAMSKKPGNDPLPGSIDKRQPSRTLTDRTLGGSSGPAAKQQAPAARIRDDAAKSRSRSPSPAVKADYRQREQQRSSSPDVQNLQKSVLSRTNTGSSDISLSHFDPTDSPGPSSQGTKLRGAASESRSSSSSRVGSSSKHSLQEPVTNDLDISSRCYEVVNSKHGDGLGVFATRNIKFGEKIIVETPLIHNLEHDPLNWQKPVWRLFQKP